MRLPSGDRAVVDLVKLSDYALSPDHEEGKHKARVFASALGLARDDASWLRDRLLDAALIHECVATRATQFGRRFTIDFELVRGGKSARIRSCWIARTDDDVPRLTTCFVL